MELVLVDDDTPVVTPSKAFFELDGTYIDGRQSYPLRVDAADAGGGVTRIDVDHTGWPGPQPPLVAHAVTCDPDHHTTALGARICPAADRVDLDVDTRPMPEGTRRFRASSPDVAGNVGDRRWMVIIDRTAPEPPRELRFTTPEEGSAEATWNSTADPVLPDGTPGSGVAGYRVRQRIAAGEWSDWRSYDRDVRVSEDVFDQRAGTAVEFEAATVDAVGNVSAVARASGAVWGAAPTVTLGAAPDEEYFGSDPLALTASARDGETGVRSVRVTHNGVQIGEWPAPCTPRNRPDGRPWKASCPTTFDSQHVVNTAGLGEGAHVFVPHAADRAGNEESGASVEILVDHTPPAAPTELRLDWFNPDTKRAQLSWMPGEDPDLSADVPGAGADKTLVSYRREGGDWSGWLTTTDDELEAAGSYVGETIGLRVRTIDEVGNTGPMREASMTVTQLTEEPDADEGEEDGMIVVGVRLLTKTGKVLTELPEAEVTVRSEDGTLHTGITNEQGRTTLGDIEPGTYDILPVRYGGLSWKSATKSVTLTDDGTATATVSIATPGSGPTRAQALWCATLDAPRANSAFCRRFWADRAVAERYADRVFSADADGARSNAFQHAYWTALMANSILSTWLLPDDDVHKALEFANLNEDEVLEADPDDVSVNDRRHARMDKHNNRVGYDYIMAVSKRENHNDRFYCNMLRRKAARAKKTRFGPNSALPGFVASDQLMFWLHNVKVLPYDHDFGDGKRPCGES